MRHRFLSMALVVLILSGCKSGNEKYLNSKWDNISLNNGQASFESPFKMDVKDVSKEIAQVKQYLVSMEMRISPESNTNFLVLADAIEYVEEITADYKSAAESSLKGVEKQGKISSISFTTSDIELAGKAGVQQSGTFKLGGAMYKFKQNVYGYKNKLVQLLVASPQKDEAGGEIMEKVLKSLTIK